MRRRLHHLGLLAVAALPIGCRIDAGAARDPDRVQVKGPGVIYATADAWRRWNGNVFELGLFNESERDGEIVSLDLGPLAGIGFGFVGLRVRLLMLEVGAATLCHDPLPLPSGYGWNEPSAQADDDSRHAEPVRAD